WVLDAACRQANAWETRLGIRLDISANLSARDLVDPTLAARVEALLVATAIEPGRLCLELTETALIDHPRVAGATLRDLRQLGVGIALDDFGTGCCSLAHLQDLPLTHIKIDRAFTAGVGINRRNTIILESTITLAQDLGLRVIAEGVETAEQFALLQSFGCDLAQGLYFGGAQAPEEFEQLLKASTVRPASCMVGP
ncbi:MAG: EAL domain-containing protein, partial [Acidimicrobiales bacterium]